MMSPRDIVKDYRKWRLEGHDTWLMDCASTKKLVEALELAALARNTANEKHPHAYRIPDSTLRAFADNLIEHSKEILSATSFGQLHELIGAHKVAGIGPLAIYDTAQRIGSRLNLEPLEVYMHRGTKVGAERYLGRKVRSEAVAKSEFPDFKALSCAEIEDVLCIYKNYLVPRSRSTKIKSCL